MEYNSPSFPFPIVHLDETESTNNYLRRLCADGTVEELTTVAADYQTSGRGQRGNSWEAERGKNLLFSVVLYPTFLEARRQFLISQIVSLSIKEELERYTDGVSIKWPNDIYWRERKICGILIENDLLGRRVSQSVAGVGLNVNQEAFAGSAPNPVSLRQITGEEHELPSMLRDILLRISAYFEELREGAADAIADRYKLSLFRREGTHPYRDADGEFMARVVDVEPEGRLVLEDVEGSLRRY
ncbi:MAG: biotin--[acetyl-CoA-carboxylase] ligase, partial [Mediterranea sp.]|nr:biotin--[acetyl-CoA-carboxylase] ligase [Mediterranea sp.]